MQFEPEPKWSVRLFDESAHRFHTPAAPAWFWRVMQHCVLGIVWERLKEQEDNLGMQRETTADGAAARNE